MRAVWLNAILLRPWLTLGLSLLLIVAAAVGSKNLYFRGDYKIFFGPGNAQLQAYEDMQSIFSKSENASIVIAPESGDVFSPQTLALIKDYTEAAWRIPYATRVDSITNFQHTSAEEDDLLVEDLFEDPQSMSQAEIQKARQVALAEPALVDKMVAADGKAAMINITVQLPEEQLDQAFRDVAAAARQLSHELSETYPQHQFYHTGIVYLNDAFVTSAEHDASTLVPLMFLTIILMLWILLRSFTGTLSTVVVLITTIVATMGISGWVGIFLSTATVNVPTLVMTLAVADCVHVISSMLYGLRQGKSKAEAIHYAMELNLMPVFITSVTTAIGFLTLNFSDVPILADLGNLTAMGIMLAFVLSVTMLPALLLLLPMRVTVKQQASSGRMEAFAEWVIANHKRLLPFTVVLTLVAIGATLKNEVNDQATEYFNKSMPFRFAADYQEEHISGMATMDFGLFLGEPSALNKPENLQVIAEFTQWLREQPEIDHVASISDTFMRLNKNMHADDNSYYRLPEDRELAAQYLLLYEMSLPFGLDLNNQINLDKSATRVMATLENLGSKEFTAFEQRALDWLAQRAPQIEVRASSPSLMFAHIGETNMASMLRGTVLALILISALLVVALRSWKMGAISLLPNLLPAGIGFGIWAVISGQINMGLSVVMSMSLGIIVDDTVHFLAKYQRARKDGADAEQAVRYAFSSVGRALWITTVVLVSGFAILSFSNFGVNADMGMLTGIIILVALAVDFLFLPAFLMVFDKSSVKKEDNADDTDKKLQTTV
ncbi:efflux RND transporter permease subunit [Bowmanella yangjiangensis]|uniref:MMPL family transporter n=1 Tax=Bowmanella yangjiangensis TaxID=2811230 RepID=A0ABS3CQ39_9ALTE|nr:MMPL family transporter [Bowmanella yangjiangensis]MBN7818576.1 MMPL family transporter [Bowmanella yangjiangensis]